MPVISTAPFPIDRRRTGITIAFENPELVADRVLPRVNSGGERFTWRKYRPGETYKVQSTMVGRSSRVNEVEFGFDEYEDLTQDWGLEAPIPQKDIDNAPQGFDPVDSATIRTTDLVLLAREKRVADLVATPANYSYTLTLTGTNRFTNYGTINPSSPIDVISTALRVMVRRANTMVLSEDAFDVLSRHPDIVAAFHGNDGKSGVATADFIMRLFRLTEIVIGSAWVDLTRTPATNQINTLSRLWGDDIALIYKDPTANIQTGITWGMTAQWKTRVVRTDFDRNIGLEGGTRVRVGEHVKEVITAPEFGYLLIDACAPSSAT